MYVPTVRGNPVLSRRLCGGSWAGLSLPAAKRPSLQGPIDDAFMDRFVMVKPTGRANSERYRLDRSPAPASAV